MGYWQYPANLLLVRILHFTDTYLPRRDGVITSLRTLSAALETLGHTSTIVAPRGQVSLPSLPCGVADLRLAHWPLTGGRDRLVAELAGHRPDVVHVHSPGPAGLLGVLLAQRLSIPLVQTYHTDLHAYAAAYRVPAPALWTMARLYAWKLGRPCPGLAPDLDEVSSHASTAETLGLHVASAARLGHAGRSRKAGTRESDAVDFGRTGNGPAGVTEGPAAWADAPASSRQRALDAGNELLLGTASAVIVPTAAVLERITLPVDPRKLYLVPTGVEKRDAAPDWRRRWGIADTDRVVLFVGRVNREKGVETLIPAFEQVLKAEPNAKLVLIGAVYEPRWLKRMIRTDRIVVTGQLPPEEVAAAYQAAEVFAFPSLTDTQALVLQEAALAGVPSVLLDEVLYEKGVLQRQAVLATKETFAEGIIGLLREREFARALGANARANAQRHTPQAFAEAILGIYDTVRRVPSRSSMAIATGTVSLALE